MNANVCVFDLLYYFLIFLWDQPKYTNNFLNYKFHMLGFWWTLKIFNQSLDLSSALDFTTYHIWSKTCGICNHQLHVLQRRILTCRIWGIWGFLLAWKACLLLSRPVKINAISSPRNQNTIRIRSAIDQSVRMF